MSDTTVKNWEPEDFSNEVPETLRKLRRKMANEIISEVYKACIDLPCISPIQVATIVHYVETKQDREARGE